MACIPMGCRPLLDMRTGTTPDTMETKQDLGCRYAQSDVVLVEPLIHLPQGESVAPRKRYGN